MTLDEALDLDISFGNFIKVLQKLNHRHQVMFALYCTKSVQHLVDHKTAKQAISITEKWLEGKATVEECKKVSLTTYSMSPARATISAVFETDQSVYYSYIAAYRAVQIVEPNIPRIHHFQKNNISSDSFKDLISDIVEYLKYLVREETEANELLKTLI